MNEWLIGWKRMLYVFVLNWLIFFLGIASAVALQDWSISVLKEAAYAAVIAVLPVVISFLNTQVKQYGLVSTEDGIKLKL